MERKSLVVFSILILLLAAQEMVEKTEGKTCEKPNKFFEGPCIGLQGNRHWGYLCVRGERVLSGPCKGFMCLCTYAC